MRELIHRGKVFRQPEGTISSTWPELTVLLFDNYCKYAIIGRNELELTSINQSCL